MKKKKQNNVNCIGKAFAGHAARTEHNKNIEKYENPLTDLVNLLIAETKAKMNKNNKE